MVSSAVPFTRTERREKRMIRDFTMSLIFWAAFTGLILAISCGPKEETSIIKAEDFTEQCRHYHYGDDRIRECMDKFLIRR